MLQTTASRRYVLKERKYGEDGEIEKNFGCLLTNVINKRTLLAVDKNLLGRHGPFHC